MTVTTEQLAHLVEQMRSAQKAYARNRMLRDLQAAKELEAAVDRIIEEIINQKYFDTLF